MDNTLIIEVDNTAQLSTECIPVGVNGEHNAVVLKFVLDAAFTSDYKYYLEFTLPNAKSFRTGYLELNSADNSLEFSVPASLTGMGCVDCCLNAANVDTSGITNQLIKPKSLTLLFSPLYNANGEILSEYDFSINTLLENIKNGAFKGEKGDKGESYILTKNDKNEITDTVAQQVFGKLITKTKSSTESLTLTDASNNNALSFAIHGHTNISKPIEAEQISKDNIAQIDGVNSITVSTNQNNINVNLPFSIYSLSSYSDTVDLVSGKHTENICVYEFDGSETIVQATILEYNGKPFYRCYFSPKRTMISGSCLPGLCTHFDKITTYISSQNKLDYLVNTGGIFNGVWFGQSNGIVYFFTEKSAAELSAFFAEQKSNGTPVRIHYILYTPREEDCVKYDIELAEDCNIALSPADCRFDLKYYADISKVIENIESKLSE